jgi:hypothetical protein
MMNLIFAMALVGSIFFLDGLYDLLFKNDAEAFFKFIRVVLVAVAAKIIVRLVTWVLVF